MAIITTLKNGNVKVYPKTKASAVYTDTGVAVSSVLTSLTDRVDAIEAAETSWSAVTNKPFDGIDTATLAVTEADGVKTLGVKADVYADKAHTHQSADIVSLEASKITGIINIDNLPKSVIERLHVVANLEAMFQLTTATVQAGDTVKTEDTGRMYYVVDEENLNNENGYQVYTAGSAASVPWSGVTDKPNEFNPAAHTHTTADINGLDTKLTEIDTALSKKIETGDVQNATVTFTTASERANVATGDTVKTAFGKIAKFFADLAAVAFSGSYNDLSDKPDATGILMTDGTTVEAAITALQASSLVCDETDKVTTDDIVVA